jgi:hypothetical protein
MKFDLDIFFGFLIGMIIILFVIYFKQTKELQTQIDELKIIVDQKFLPAMILDKESLNVR